jgi:hypothetical protein
MNNQINLVAIGNVAYEMIGDVSGILGATKMSMRNGLRNVRLRSSVYEIRDLKHGCKFQVNRIGSCAFTECCLEQIQIPFTVESIGERCFSGCKSLREISFEFGSRLRFLGEYGFQCTGLKCIQFPRTLESIGKYCFYRCFSLKAIHFESESKLKRIEQSAFMKTNLKKIDIPSSVEFIGEQCFSDCSFLEEITFDFVRFPIATNWEIGVQ